MTNSSKQLDKLKCKKENNLASKISAEYDRIEKQKRIDSKISLINEIIELILEIIDALF